MPQWAEKWGIGQAKEDNGVLILLARDDRKIDINTGYGVEHLLTDAMCKRIIEKEISFLILNKMIIHGGLNKGADAIFEVLNGEYQGTRKSSIKMNFLQIHYFHIILFLLLFIISISKNKRGGGGNSGHRSEAIDILEAIILSNMGRGSYRR